MLHLGDPPSRTSQAQTRRRAPRPNGKRKVRCAILWGIRSRSDVQGDGFQNLSRPRHSTFHRPWQCCSGCDVCGWIPIACVYVESLGGQCCASLLLCQFRQRACVVPFGFQHHIRIQSPTVAPLRSAGNKRTSRSVLACGSVCTG